MGMKKELASWLLCGYPASFTLEVRMAPIKQSDRIRQLVSEQYVRPALRAGQVRLSIKVRDVLKAAEATADFPRGRTPLICEVLQGKKLLSEHGLEIESVDGPPSKQSRTVVVHYRLADGLVQRDDGKGEGNKTDPLLELAGILKGAFCEGVDTFIRNIRMDKEQAS